MGIDIGMSYDSFRSLRESGSYYVDKTEIIEQYLSKHFDKAVLFARPRRFGKTLTMTMFRDFLDIRQDSRDIFNGLEIMDHQDVIDKYMNKYPVIFLSLKEVSGADFDEIMGNLRVEISKKCKTLDDLLESNRVDDADKKIFTDMKWQQADDVNTVAVLDLLARMLHDHYGKQVFVIIDEYDVPMAKALGKPHYDKIRDMVEHMLSYVCKTNDNVKAVMLSGCLYTVKNSTYTGVNNIIPYTVLNPMYASYIGFKDDDVRRLLADAGISDRYDTVKEWYDGYLFGRDRMYCPWDVLRYVGAVLDGSYSEAMGPENYWANTSETALDIIHGFFGKTSEMMESFEQLLAGKTIPCTVNELVPYHRIHDSGENIWSALVETGYLTKAVEEKMPRMPLKIPNKEIREVFRQEVWEYFKDKVNTGHVKDLERALWDRDATRAEEVLGIILESTLSFYHEYQEYSYHLILDGMFTGMGYQVRSETETGYGRSDLMILDPAAGRCMILELKHVKKLDEMEAALKEAIDQIVTKKYESLPSYEGYTRILKYGMAFCDKRVMIAKASCII